MRCAVYFQLLTLNSVKQLAATKQTNSLLYIKPNQK